MKSSGATILLLAYCWDWPENISYYFLKRQWHYQLQQCWDKKEVGWVQENSFSVCVLFSHLKDQGKVCYYCCVGEPLINTTKFNGIFFKVIVFKARDQNFFLHLIQLVFYVTAQNWGPDEVLIRECWNCFTLDFFTLNIRSGHPYMCKHGYFSFQLSWFWKKIMLCWSHYGSSVL